jgi:hypothetical protein
MPTILQLVQPETLSFYVLGNSPLTIGRSTAADLQFISLDICPIHAEDTHEGNHHVIRGKGSRPMQVNGEVITERLLTHGDHIRIGWAEFVYMADVPKSQSVRDSDGAIDLARLRNIGNFVAAQGSGASLEELLTLILDEVLAATTAGGCVLLPNARGDLECTLARIGSPAQLSTEIPRDVFATGKSRIVQTEVGALGVVHEIARNIYIPLRILPQSREMDENVVHRTIGVLTFGGTDRTSMVSAVTESAVDELAEQIAVALGTVPGWQVGW